ncbi:MAG TPA: sugar phosphate isomerase/epimerase [Casimicrobiaceae bacterium]|nr:sugar phosphate isomerase/epimerase [Casimicrobiaceae bacterium]
MNRAPTPLSLSYYTVPELAPPDMVRAAADAGFDYVGVRLLNGQPRRDPAPLLENPALRRETLAYLRHTGIEVLDASGARLVPETDLSAFGNFFEAAAELGARHVLATGDDPDEARLADRFARLSDAAQRFGLTVDIEFVPWMTLSSLNDAARMVRTVAHPALGIAVDALHFDRSGSRLDDLAGLPRTWFRYVQLCDAPAQWDDDRDALLHAATRERLFPGEGAIDLVGLLRALPIGIPVALEIPRAALSQTMPAHQRLELATRAVRHVLEQAYGGQPV